MGWGVIPAGRPRLGRIFRNHHRRRWRRAGTHAGTHHAGTRAGTHHHRGAELELRPVVWNRAAIKVSWGGSGAERPPWPLLGLAIPTYAALDLSATFWKFRALHGVSLTDKERSRQV